MMRLLIWLLIGYGVYLLLRGRAKKEIAPKPQAGRDETESYQDPVCGMYVAREDALVGTVEGKRIYFCSMKCLDQYREQLQHEPAEPGGTSK